MKKILAAIIALALIGAPALASTHIWTEVHNTGGYTKFAENAQVGGEDWSEGAETTDPDDWNTPSKRYTANINQGFENKGSVYMIKGVHTPTAWELEEKTELVGSGKTEIWKEVTAWTEDKKVDPETGKLVYPTKAWVEVDFSTPKPFHDAESWFVNMNMPSAHDDDAEHGIPDEEEQTAYYGKAIVTDEDFNFLEKVGINNFPCNYQIPEWPEYPEFHWIGR